MRLGKLLKTPEVLSEPRPLGSGHDELMASRLNLLFQTAPRQFLERTVLFTDELSSPASLALMRNRIAHHLDIQPIKERATVRVLSGLHQYSDAHLTSYFALPNISIFIPRENPPYRFVFLPEFNDCRLLLRADGEQWLRVECEQNLPTRQPPPEATPGSPYLDSFAYWDHTTGDLVGRIRATAVLVKEPDQPWTILMQQIVGTPGFEVVRRLETRALQY